MRAIWSPPPDGDQSSSSAATDVREISRRLSSSSSPETPSFWRDLVVGRRAHELALEDLNRALDLPRARADGARHPVERAELVDDRAADPGHRERLELDLAVRVVALDRADEAEQAVRDEILLVHVRRQARADAAGDELHERCIRQDQAVPDVLIARRAVLLPKVVRFVSRSHGGTIRRAPANSSRAAGRVFATPVSPSSRRAHRPPARLPRPGRPRAPRRPPRARARSPGRANRAPSARRCMSGVNPLWLRATKETRLHSAAQPRGVAQLVEHRSPKPGVAGSSPVAPVPMLPYRPSSWP